MNIAYKYRIYPTTEQKIFIAKTFGCCRKIWNLMLSDNDIAHFLKYKNYRRSTYDNGYGILLSLLEYKAADKGKLFVKVDKDFPSTKLCSCCGYIEEKLKDISIRNWVCPKCNTSHNRDVNAAINIKNEGLRMLAVTT